MFTFQLYYFYIFITVLGNSEIIDRAVTDRPYLSNAALVAYLVILLASIGPKSGFQNVHTPVTPASISPIPPHLFLLP